MKYKIEKNTVQETLIIPLYARKVCSELYPNLYRDETAVRLIDAANRAAVKMIAKTWLKSAKIKDVGAYFAVSDAPKEIGAWDNRLRVTSRGYMLGYNDLRDPSVSGFFRFLAKVGDGMMKMQIVKIGFGGKQ